MINPIIVPEKKDPEITNSEKVDLDVPEAEKTLDTIELAENQ